MSSWPVLTLQEATTVDPALARILLGDTSLDFFEPTTRHVSWEVARKPLTGGRIVMLVADRPVSRAWHAVFIKAFWAVMNERFGSFGQPFAEVTKQVPASGPVRVVVELGESDDGRHKVVEAVKVATETANALGQEGEQHCQREHDKLAQKFGIARSPIGF